MRVFVWIGGLDGDFDSYVPHRGETLEDFAEGYLVEETELFEVEPYKLDSKLFRDELERKGIHARSWKVVRAISYDADNPDEFQEIEVVTDAH